MISFKNNILLSLRVANYDLLEVTRILNISRSSGYDLVNPKRDGLELFKEYNQNMDLFLMFMEDSHRICFYSSYPSSGEFAGLNVIESKIFSDKELELLLRLN